MPGPDGEETFILARSADRRAKEQAMHEKFTSGWRRACRRCRPRPWPGRLKDEAAAGERLGRLKEQNWRASQAFEVTIKKLAQPRGKQRSGNHLAASGQIRRLVAACRWLLPAPQQSDGRRRGDALETLHPADGSGMGLPHHQG